MLSNINMQNVRHDVHEEKTMNRMSLKQKN